MTTMWDQYLKTFIAGQRELAGLPPICAGCEDREGTCWECDPEAECEATNFVGKACRNLTVEQNRYELHLCDEHLEQAELDAEGEEIRERNRDC